MRVVHRAILLLAGRGRRLGALTESRPKCLLEVAGRPILEQTLQALAGCGVSEAILVVGYRAPQIYSFAGSHHAGIDLTYVVNERHAETNTAYSLWLARRYLDGDCLLVEGDILFDAAVLRRVLECTGDGSVWAALPVAPGLDEGVLLRADGGGRVAAVDLVREPLQGPARGRYKCAGIQLVGAAMARALAASLDAAIAAGQTGLFADLVLGGLAATSPVALCSLEGMRWAEVDDVEDLRRAGRLFHRHLVSSPAD